jgi:hypothetical protein
MKDGPEWQTLSDGGRLVYRGHALVEFYRDDPGVRVRTRCYSEGYQENRLVATPEGAKRYGDSWLRKWGDQATREVDNKISWAEGERQRRKEADERRARGESDYPEIKVRPWKPRRRR